MHVRLLCLLCDDIVMGSSHRLVCMHRLCSVGPFGGMGSSATCREVGSVLATGPASPYRPKGIHVVLLACLAALQRSRQCM